MASLERVLDLMDQYDWDKVKNMDASHSQQEWLKTYKKRVKRNWNKRIRSSGFVAIGTVLDLCCGPVSFGMLHPKTIGYDKDPVFIKNVRKNGYKGALGDLRKLPFDNDTFDNSVCFYPPMVPFDDHMKLEKGIDDASYVEGIVDELMRVTKDNILILSPFFVDLAPKKYKHLQIKRFGDQLHYGCREELVEIPDDSWVEKAKRFKDNAALDKRDEIVDLYDDLYTKVRNLDREKVRTDLLDLYDRVYHLNTDEIKDDAKGIVDKIKDKDYRGANKKLKKSIKKYGKKIFKKR